MIKDVNGGGNVWEEVSRLHSKYLIIGGLD